MFYSNNAFSTVVLFFIYLIALLLSTLFPMASAMPIRGRSSPQEVRAYPPVSREFVRIHQDRDGTIKLAQASPGDGLYSVYNETHAQYHSGDNLDPDTTNMQRRSIEPFLPRHKNPKRQFDGSCAAQCGTKSANPADIRAAEAALDAQFSSSQYGLSWGVGQYIGTDGSVFQVVNNVYAYGCDQGGKGQTTTSEEYAFQVQCLTESCAVRVVIDLNFMCPNEFEKGHENTEGGVGGGGGSQRDKSRRGAKLTVPKSMYSWLPVVGTPAGTLSTTLWADRFTADLGGVWLLVVGI
ncbi:hypothetical protein EV359DRAFT_64983 [Lentinula novae-zelandiae]|nr:hypothetical protein EV359DRAFT_64983 [Lentinula novae-zelandiae]